MNSLIDPNVVYDLYFNQKLSLKNVGEQFEVGPDAIKGVLKRNGWSPRSAYELERKVQNPNEIVRLYKSGINGPELAKRFNTDAANIYRILKKNNVKIQIGERNRKYTINENFFSKWSPLMAYWLGFLCADGYMNKNKNQISLSQADEEHLKHFLNDLGANNKIIRKIRGDNCFSPGSTQLIASICSKSIHDKLIELGFLNFKQGGTTLIKIIPPKLFSHWLRGMTDGDGTVSIIKPCANKPYPTWRLVSPFSEQLEYIASVIIKNVPITPLNVYKSKTIFVITCKRLKSFKLLKYLYKDNIRSLKRKKDKFEAIINQFYTNYPSK